MKQGERRRKLPKDKHTKESWKKRNEARAGAQERHLQKIADAEAAAAAIEAEQSAITVLLGGITPDEAAAGVGSVLPVRTSDYYREDR